MSLTSINLIESVVYPRANRRRPYTLKELQLFECLFFRLIFTYYSTFHLLCQVYRYAICKISVNFMTA